MDRLVGSFDHAVFDRGVKFAGDIHGPLVVIAHRLRIAGDALIFEEGVPKSDIGLTDPFRDARAGTDHRETDAVGHIDGDLVDRDGHVIDVIECGQDILEAFFTGVVVHDDRVIQICTLI